MTTTSSKVVSEFFKGLYAFTPTALVTFLSHWQGLLGGTGLAHRDFQPRMDKLARGISVFAVLALYVWLHNSSRKALGRIFTVFASLFGVMVATCIVFDVSLDSFTTEAGIERAITLWGWFYFLVLVFESITVVVFMLWINARPDQSADRTGARE